MYTVRTSFEVRAVRQGAFLRGEVTMHSRRATPLGQPIRWVYDCGTDEVHTLVDHSIQRMKNGPDDLQWAGDRLDVLIVSHFDKDHISGLAELLRHYSFDRVFLPHMPRLMRLALVLDGLETVKGPHEDEDDSAAQISWIQRVEGTLRFTDNPLAYIAGSRPDDDRQTQVILVGPGAPREPGGPAVRPRRRRGEPALGIQDPARVLDPDAAYAQVLGMPPDTHNGHRVVLKETDSGAPFVWNELWELIPYVDRVSALRLLQFSTAVDTALQQQLDGLLCQAATMRANYRKGDRVKLSAAIKALRDALYGFMEATAGAEPDDKDKNAISLIVHMGAIAPHMEMAELKKGQSVSRCCFAPVAAWPALRTSSVLLTGDADLRDPGTLADLERALTPARLKRIGVLQIPHHGSRNNSSKQTARLLDNGFAFVNADPEGAYGHPDNDVLSLYGIRGRPRRRRWSWMRWGPYGWGPLCADSTLLANQDPVLIELEAWCRR